MARRTIGALARDGGVGVETVRYYQRRGLLETPPPTGGDGFSGGVRRYDDEALRRLRFIRSAQAAGFTLEQIGELLELDASEDRVRAREIAQTRLLALNAKIAELEAARASLERLAKACGAAENGPCPIIAAFQTEAG